MHDIDRLYNSSHKYHSFASGGEMLQRSPSFKYSKQKIETSERNNDEQTSHCTFDSKL